MADGVTRPTGTDPIPRPPGLDDMAALRPEVLFDCSDATAIVVGGGGGVGSWLAAGLALAGAGVVVADISAERVEPITRLIEDAGGSAHGFAGDISDHDTVQHLMEMAYRASSRPLRVMVNAAAVNRRLPALDVDPETYDWVMDVDLRMPFFLSQAAARAMKATGGGSIIHISSTNARFGLQSTSVYAAAKAGLDQLARTLAVEWAPHGIRVNCIAPGFLMTELSRPLWDQAPKRSWILDRVPLARPGSPVELLGACLLLASAAGSFITGQTLTVDGGFLAGNDWESTGATT
ncbi:MAG TPA: SDR family oxidoreductase [Acidimicrobiia bacterium]|nr:SDR family oxidoreductase [Acidimicrobiia bacterium]